MPVSPRLSWSEFGLAYLVAFAALAVLDGIWLGALASGFYKRELGDLMADSVRIVPAVLFYLLFPLGLVVLALQPTPASALEAIGRCAFLGLVGYGVYDLSNLATLRGWSVRLAVVDIIWGVFASAVAGAITWYVAMPSAAKA